MYSVCGRHLYSDEELLVVFEMTRSVGTRGHFLKMLVQVCRSEMRRTLEVRCVFLWYSLPADVVQTTSMTTFKRRLVQFIEERLYKTVDGC